MSKAVRWGSGKRDDDGEFARQKLMTAASACYQKKSVRQTTMNDIAEEAKVVRTTVYKYFKNREEILRCVYRADVEEFNAAFGKRCGRYNDFCSLLLGFMVYALTESPKMRLYKSYFNDDSAPWIEEILLYDEGAIDSSVRLLSPHFEKALQSGEIRKGINLVEMVTWAHRINSSTILSPVYKEQSIHQMRRQVEQFFIQSIRA